MSILLKRILMMDGMRRDILIKGNRIAKIGSVREKAEKTIDGKDKAVLPGFVNMHTHAAMTLFRGFADDMEFYEAWPKKIWPAESKLAGRDVYAGTKLACLEMLKSGTTCFNDMYFYSEDIARAVRETGIRAVVSELFLDRKEVHAYDIGEKKTIKVMDAIRKAGGSRVTPAMGPHAVYTLSKESLSWISGYAREHGLLMHTHLSETRKENEDCVKKCGMRPVELLDSIGFLGDNVIASHCVWLTKAEVGVLARRNVTAVHNPTSNMKLASGGVMPYPEMRQAGMNVTLGTDGCASNNSLSMFEAMKTAALLQKSHRWDQTVLPAADAIEMATANAGRALRLEIGKIAEGMLADLILIDLNRPELTPRTNLQSNIVYAANAGCVDTAICDGRIVMEKSKVRGEERIMAEAEKTAERLMAKVG